MASPALGLAGRVALLAGIVHQLSYALALPFQVAADVPGAVAVDPFEPVIAALYVVGAVLLSDLVALIDTRHPDGAGREGVGPRSPDGAAVACGARLRANQEGRRCPTPTRATSASAASTPRCCGVPTRRPSRRVRARLRGPLPGNRREHRRRLRALPLGHGTDAVGPGPYFHRTMSEAFFVLAGVVLLHDGTGTREAGPGDFLHVPPGGVHGFNESGEPASMLILFTPGAPREAY